MHSGHYGGEQNVTTKPYYKSKVNDLDENVQHDNRFVDPSIKRFKTKPINIHPDQFYKYEPIEEETVDLSKIETGKIKHIVNIDSSKRIKTPKNIYGMEGAILTPYPFVFTNGSENIRVIHPGHPFNVNDRI